jgi:hypothetical protein
MPLLFSYGTLQYEGVQISSFGRKLLGEKDVLTGYKIEQLEITDPSVLEASKENFHPIAFPSSNPHDQVEGILFEITDAELLQADAYEVADYQRVEAQFLSGKIGWVYVARH